MPELVQESEIDAILASPLALNLQNQTVASESAAWFTQYSKAQRIRIVSIVFFSSLVSSLSALIYYPCLWEIKNDFDVSHIGALTLVSYGSLFLWALFTPIWGVLSDRYSRKWVHLICLCSFILSTFLIIWIPTTWGQYGVAVFIILSFLLAIGACGIPAVTIRIVFEILPPSSLGIVISFFLGITALSVFVGPLIAGAIVQGLSWKFCYLALSIAGVLMFFLHLFLVPDTLNKGKQQYGTINPFKRLTDSFKSPEFVSVATLISLATSFLFLVYLMMATVFPKQYSFTSLEIGSVFSGIGVSLAIGAIAGAVISFFLQKKYDIAGRLMVPLIVVYVLAFGSLVLGWSLEESKQDYVAITIIILCSILRGLILPGLFTYCIELNPKNSFGTIETLTVVQYFVSALFQMVGTILGVFISYTVTFIIIGFLMMICALPVILYLFKRWSRYRAFLAKN